MTPPETGKKFRSYVPDKTEMREFTVRAVLLGLVMTIVLGAANLYLGLRAGMTDRKSTRLNSSHLGISYAVFCLRKESCGVCAVQMKLEFGMAGKSKRSHRRP